MQKESEKFIDSDILEGMSSISALLKAIEAEKNPRRILRVLFDRTKEKSKYKELRFLEIMGQKHGFSVERVDRALIDERASSMVIGLPRSRLKMPRMDLASTT